MEHVNRRLFPSCPSIGSLVQTSSQTVSSLISIRQSAGKLLDNTTLYHRALAVVLKPAASKLCTSIGASMSASMRGWEGRAWGGSARPSSTSCGPAAAPLLLFNPAAAPPLLLDDQAFHLVGFAFADEEVAARLCDPHRNELALELVNVADKEDGAALPVPPLHLRNIWPHTRSKLERYGLMKWIRSRCGLR